MELNQLRYFQKVARVGSVTRAAEELYISQSTLSQCLSRLEESVGCPLFQRQRGRAMQLNEAGSAFLETVEELLMELEQGVDRARAISSKDAMQVSVASSIRDLCNELVLDYFQSTPGIRISQRLVEINAIQDLLMDDRVDFAITPCPLWDARLDCRTLYTEELMVAVGPEHPLRGKKRVAVHELLGEKFICNYSEADRYFLKMLFADEPVSVILDSNEPRIIQNLLDRGAGVAFIPARVIMRNVNRDSADPDRFLRIGGHEFDVPTCISKKKKRYLTRAAAGFYDYIVSFCQGESRQVEEFLQQHYR